jgi:hypothetical protein
MSRVVREILQFPAEKFEIQIEVDDAPVRAFERREDYGPMREGQVPLTSRPFEKGMTLIRACAEQVAATVHQLSESARPSEVEVELGVKFDGEVGALISRTGAEAHLQVTLRWSRKEAK